MTLEQTPAINEVTKFFFDLTPDRILDAVESAGLHCTGRCLTLNSMENRVYEVEVDIDHNEAKTPSDNFRVVKFYRPGRWSEEQILEEHQFLFDLETAEIPVVAPIRFPDGTSLRRLGEIGIYFAVFPKRGGRTPDEVTEDQAEWLGRLLARLHIVGKQRKSEYRLSLTSETYGRKNLEFLLQHNFVPTQMRGTYETIVLEICSLSDAIMKGVPTQRVHGDCHLGNIVWGSSGPAFIDFDDMVNAPPVQDLWLLCPAQDSWGKSILEATISGYEQLADFPRSTLRLIEPLRALRMVHFTTWIAKRWDDPAFKRVFDRFGTPGYWNEQLQNIREQLQLIQELTD